MVLARGRFDEVKIEALMREHGAHVEDYSGRRLIVGDAAKVRSELEATGVGPMEVVSPD